MASSTFKLISSDDAFVLTEEMDDYQRGVYFLARRIRDILHCQYFAHKVSADIPDANDVGINTIDQLQAAVTVNALDRLSAIGIRNLVEANKDSWNFNRLFKQIEKRIHHEQSDELHATIQAFTERWKTYKDHTDQRIAHLARDQNPNTFASFVGFEPVLLESIELLDKFVDGEIPYVITVGEKTIDLRDDLSKKAEEAKA